MSGSSTVAAVFQRLVELCEKSDDADAFKSLALSVKNVKELFIKTTAEEWTLLMVAAFYQRVAILKVILAPKALLNEPRVAINFYHTTASGATVFDVCQNKAILKLLRDEDERLTRLRTSPTVDGYHETSKVSFDFIKADAMRHRFPMIGGAGGYFGGGIYFAASPIESSRKALHNGFGLRSKLALGHVYKIQSFNELKAFYNEFCDGDNQYKIPTDIIQKRLLAKGFDSVWGHHNAQLPAPDRILKTGDEYVVYSADQVTLEDYYDVRCRKFYMDTYNRDNYSKSVVWISVSEKNQLIPPSRPARYFNMIGELKKVPEEPWSVVEVRERLRKKGELKEGDDLQTGDIVEFRPAELFEDPEDNQESIGKYVCIYQKYKTGLSDEPYRETWLLYGFTEDMKQTTEEIKDVMYEKSPIYFSKAALEWVGLDSMDKLIQHYKDVLQKAYEYPIEFLIIQKTNIGDPVKWEQYFPLISNRQKYYYYIKTFFNREAFLAQGRNMYVLGSVYNTLKIEKLELPLTEERQITLLTYLYRPYLSVLDTNITLDFYAIFNGKKYTFQRFYDLRHLEELYPTMNVDLQRSTPNTLVIKECFILDYNNFRDRIMMTKYARAIDNWEEENVYLPLFHLPSRGSFGRNAKIEPTDDTNNRIVFEFSIKGKYSDGTALEDNYTEYMYVKSWVTSLLLYNFKTTKKEAANGSQHIIEIQPKKTKVYTTTEGMASIKLLSPEEELEKRLIRFIEKSPLKMPMSLSHVEMTV